MLYKDYIFTVVAKNIRTLVFSTAKNGFKVSYFYLLLYCVSRTYQFSFPNINLATNCLRFLL